MVDPTAKSSDQATEDALRLMGFIGEGDRLITAPGPLPGQSAPQSPPAPPVPPAAPADPAAPPAAGAPAAPAAPPAPPAPGTPPPEKPPKKRRKIDDVAESVQQLRDRLERPVPVPPPAAPPLPAQPELTPEQAELAQQDRALEYLAQTHPKYAGRDLKSEMTVWRKKQGTYQSQWEEANPGQDFDEEDEQHSPFYDRWEPEITEKDLIIAEAQLRAQETADQRYRAEMYRVHTKNRTTEAENSSRSAVGSLLAAVDPKFRGKSMAEVEAADPYVAEAVEIMKPVAASRAKLAINLFHSEAPLGFDANNPEHLWMNQLVMETEKVFASQPPEQTMWKGKQFLPVQQYMALIERQPEQREHYWSLYAEPELVRNLAMSDTAEEVKERAERMRTRFGRSLPQGQPQAASGQPPASTTPQPAPASQPAYFPPPAPAPVNPPSSGGGGTAVPTPITPANPFDVSHFFGGS